MNLLINRLKNDDVIDFFINNGEFLLLLYERHAKIVFGADCVIYE